MPPLKCSALFLLLTAASASAQTQTFTESVLYNFVCTSAACPQSSSPGNLVQGSDGNFYGTAFGGATETDMGEVFVVTPSGKFTQLYSFCSKGGSSCSDGAYPAGALLEGADGNFYGTTYAGGTGNAAACTENQGAGCGTVFKITPAGALTTLYNFCSGGANCSDGYSPLAALAEGPNGNFYGTTYYGGACTGSASCGTIFEITPAGKLTTLYSFCSQTNCSDGANPVAALTLASDGNLYGTATGGGTFVVAERTAPRRAMHGDAIHAGATASVVQSGVVFKITPAGQYTLLYTFCNQVSGGVCLDGYFPNALVVGTDGNFYGTTQAGGKTNVGTAFQLTASAKLTTIYNFCSTGAANCSDGYGPFDLTLASDGNFYGSTYAGGTEKGGTFFRLTPSGTLTTLYTLCSTGGSNCTDGANPNDLTQGTDGNFYSTTVSGGSGTACTVSTTNGGCGTVIKLTASPAEPFISSGTAANGATYISGGLVPGSWAQVKGTALSGATRIWTGSDFTGLGNNLPTNLSGVQVMVNKIPAAVYYISPSQISFQVPAGVSGNASVQVIDGGVASNTLTAAASNSSPGIFPVIVNGVNYPAGVFLDGDYVGDPTVNPAFRSAKPGDVIQLYATGLAATPAGVLSSAQSVSGVTVTIGATVIPADFAGLVAVGEFQINFTVPQSFATQPAGLYPISLQVGGASSPTTINSSPPGQLVIPIQP